jgi:PST family polysaccharide transporter
LKPLSAKDAFTPATGEVRELAVRGAGATVLSGGGGLAIQIVSAMVMARLLTPRDFGVVAMVTTFSLLLSNFGLNGFTEAVLQREEMDHALASNLFWINLSAGLLLTVGFAAAGPLLARFYRDPVVARITAGVSLTIVITSLSVLHLALLKRAMRFPATSANDIIARFASVVVSIVLGFAGWGYWALVAGAVTLPLAQSIGAWYLCRWLPSLPRRVPGTASMVRFALHVYGRFSINYFARNMDNLLVGWRFGAHSLGFYKKAYDLYAGPVSAITGPLTNVAVSALSRFRRDSVQYRQNILRALALMAFVGMGLSGVFTLAGKDVIRVLLGPKWDEAGRIFTFFGPGVGVMLLYHSNGWIHLSIGRPDRWFRWGLVELLFTGLLFLLALPWGPVGIAVAWTASFLLLAVPAYLYAGRPIRLGVIPVAAVVWKYPFASLLAGCASAVIIRGSPFLVTMSGAVGALTRIVVVSVLFGSLYLGAVTLLHWDSAPVLQFARLLRRMVPWRSFQGRTQPAA